MLSECSYWYKKSMPKVINQIVKKSASIRNIKLTEKEAPGRVGFVTSEAGADVEIAVLNVGRIALDF